MASVASRVGITALSYHTLTVTDSPRMPVAGDYTAAATQLYSTGSGAAVITYYSEELFTTVGLSRDLSKILGASDLTCKLVCCAIPFFLIERAGRRKLLMIAGTGMTVCMVSLGYLEC